MDALDVIIIQNDIAVLDTVIFIHDGTWRTRMFQSQTVPYLVYCHR